MEKVMTWLKFILLLGAVLALLGFVEIQAYRTVDMDLARNSVRSVKEGRIDGPKFPSHGVAEETLFQTNYRLVLRL